MSSLNLAHQRVKIDAPIPQDLLDRHVEFTEPVDGKMVIKDFLTLEAHRYL